MAFGDMRNQIESQESPRCMGDGVPVHGNVILQRYVCRETIVNGSKQRGPTVLERTESLGTSPFDLDPARPQVHDRA